MKYMLLIHCNEQAWTEAERQECFAESQQLQRELEAEGRFLAASPLQPAATSMCVKVRQGKRSTSSNRQPARCPGKGKGSKCSKFAGNLDLLAERVTFKLNELDF